MTSLNIKVIPSSSQRKLVDMGDGSIKVYLHSPPNDNKANKELILLLSKTFKVPKTSIIILKGQKSRNKTVKINCSTNLEALLKSIDLT